MRSSDKITTYLRNASSIKSIDETNGTWVVVGFPDGSSGRLAYSNSVSELRDGTLSLQKTNGTTQVIIGRGVTGIMGAGGFTTPVFQKYGSRTNALQVSYRVSEPALSGDRAANDAGYAASVSFVTCLRNAGD